MGVPDQVEVGEGIPQASQGRVDVEDEEADEGGNEEDRGGDSVVAHTLFPLARLLAGTRAGGTRTLAGRGLGTACSSC